MRRLLALLLLLAAPAALARMDDGAQKKAIAEGIALFDAGSYDAAIAKFKAVLAADPRNADAAHELALTYTAKSQFRECRDLLQPWVKDADAAAAILFDPLGNCLDAMGKPDEAIAVYRRGLELRPNDPLLSFNLALTLGTRGKLDEARELLKSELRQRPGHASGHLALGQIYRIQGFRVPATIELLRFLALEPTSSRSKTAATQALELLNLGVKKTGEKNIELKIDPNSPKTEGDFGAVEMMWAIASGARFAEESAKKSEFERLVDQVGGSIAMLVEMNETPGADFVSQAELPFFAELYKAKRVDAFVAIAFNSLRPSGYEAWVKLHQAEVEKTFDWLAEQKEPPPIAVPQP
jgi:tetratricopeptide (TPR) repeat protein